MNLREQILRENSRANADLVVEWIGNDRGRFDELLQLFLSKEYKVVQRAAQIMSLVNDEQPQLVAPHLAKILEKMLDPHAPIAAKRNGVRILQAAQIPEPLHSTTMNICFDLLADPAEAIAVRAFSMIVLSNLANIYPDIKHELKAVIEDGLAQAPSPGFSSRALKTLKSL